MDPADAPNRPGTPPTRGGVLGPMLRALRHRNYRLFFYGQGVSLIGTWLTQVATSWLVYRLSGSAWLLGMVGFAGRLPMFLLAPIAGVWVDRVHRHRLLIATQVGFLLVSAALAALSLTGVVTVTHVFVLSIIQGLITSLDMPARQAFVVEMVEGPEDLPNAIALNSSLVNAARLLGPSAAGVLIAAVGEGLCFAIDAASYVFVIVALVMMTVHRRPADAQRRHPMAELREGFAYALGFKPVRALLLLIAVVSLMGMSQPVLMPVFARTVFHGDARTFGFLTAAAGVGSLAGALYLASRRSVLGLGRVMTWSAGLMGAGLVGFALSRHLPVSLVLMLAVGFGMILTTAAANTILQTIVPDRMRGRVMSFFSMSFVGMAPFGSLLAGALAERMGAPGAFMVAGITIVVTGGVFALVLPRLRPLIRPIYAQKGIVPAATQNLDPATS